MSDARVPALETLVEKLRGDLIETNARIERLEARERLRSTYGFSLLGDQTKSTSECAPPSVDWSPLRLDGA